MIVLISAFVIFQVTTLSCMSQTNQPVAWWIVIKVPPKYGTNSYGYYDSTMKTGELQYHNSMVDIN